MEEKLEKVRDYLNKAYLALNGVAVQGESVDYMAAARENIRQAYAAIGEEHKEDE